MTLEEVSSHLINKNCDDNLQKTKMRRLYDIVNVFKVMGLIDKERS